MLKRADCRRETGTAFYYELSEPSEEIEEGCPGEAAAPPDCAPEGASDFGTSGSSSGGWEVIQKKSDIQLAVRDGLREAEAGYQCTAGPVGIDSQDDEDYIRWVAYQPAMAPSMGVALLTTTALCGGNC